MNKIEILRPAELAQMLGISKVTLWRYEKQDDFPPKIKLGPRAVGYRLSDVEAYLAKRTSGGQS